MAKTLSLLDPDAGIDHRKLEPDWALKAPRLAGRGQVVYRQNI